MSGIKDVALEVAQSIAADGDVMPAMDALLGGRVELGAIGPSGRVWVGDPSAIVEFVTKCGFGLVARIDGGPWVTVRKLQPAESTPGASSPGPVVGAVNSQVTDSEVARIEGTQA